MSFFVNISQHHTLTIGVEVECFLAHMGAITIPVIAADYGLPHDDCGYLAEFRPDKGSCEEETFAHYCGAKQTFLDKIREYNLIVMPFATVKVPPAILRKCMRSYGKNPYQANSLYGYEDMCSHRNLGHAGTHIHFGCGGKIDVRMTETNDCGRASTEAVHTYDVRHIDMVKVIRGMDAQYNGIITENKRRKGFYEMKPYGFEYRSLPSIMDNDLMWTVIKSAWELLRKSTR